MTGRPRYYMEQAPLGPAIVRFLERAKNLQGDLIHVTLRPAAGCQDWVYCSERVAAPRQSTLGGDS